MHLLLDEHLPPGLAEALRDLDVLVETLQQWEGGAFLRAPDDLILSAAASERLILVTIDRRSIQPLLRRWIHSGRHHCGVIFMQQRDARRDRIGASARRLAGLLADLEGVDWTDRIVDLPRE